MHTDVRADVKALAAEVDVKRNVVILAAMRRWIGSG
jgi:hypothetical protein